MTSKHTDLPWKLSPERDFIILMPEAAEVGHGHKYIAVGGGNTEANVEFILKAVNSHYEMLEAIDTAVKELEFVRDEYAMDVLIDHLKGIANKARGESDE